MIDFGELGRAFTPSEKSLVKEALADLKLAKSENGRLLMLQPVKNLLLKERVLSKNGTFNSNDIEEAALRSLEDSDLVLGAVKNKEMSTPMINKVNDRFIKNPTTGKLEGSSKKKVVSEATKDTRKEYLFEDKFGGSVAARIKDREASIYDVWSKEKGHGLYENAIKDLSNQGVDTVTVLLQSGDSTSVLKRLTEKGVLKNPRNFDDAVKNGYPRTFDIVKNKLSTLEQEAKGKTLEEFVKAQGAPLLHGSKDLDKILKQGFSLETVKSGVKSGDEPGIYLSNDFSRSSKYGNVGEFYLKPNLKIAKTTNEEIMTDAFGKGEKFKNGNVNRYFKNQGYDGVTIVGKKGQALGEGKTETIIFDPKNIYTKSQLTDIWNKANGTLEQEAKGKTLEEFVKAKSGNQGIYDKTYDEMIQKNRAGAKPFDYELMELLDAIPETKDGNVKIYRATTNGEILPGDNVSIYDMKQYVDPNNRGLNITAAKMGVTKLSGNKDIKFVEKWIPKEDLYQTDAGTQLYAPNGMKSLTDIWKKANKK